MLRSLVGSERCIRDRIANLVGILDAGMGEGLYHANINVLNRETLIDAMAVSYTHLTLPTIYPV